MPPKGYKHSEEAKARISAAHKGMSGKKHTDETKSKISAIHSGRKHTEESKKNMSEARKGNSNRKGKKASDETKAKISSSLTGTKHTEESKKKISRNNRGLLKGARSTWYDVEMPDGTIQKVQGTYELRYARHLLSQGLAFTTQPKPGLKYVDQFGGTHKYNPDFWVPSLESYVEIKSTYTLGLRGARKKLEMVQKAGHPLIILTEVELSEMGIDMKSKIE